MAEGFLGRWSQRKQALRTGKVPAEPASKTASEVANVVKADDKVDRVQPECNSNGVANTATLKNPTELPKLPTLQDVQHLTAESDFAPFVARDVASEVRNAAMKKLFTDPHYNVMDRLDIYIDDYSKPDPLPASMLRQMVGAKFLNLFEEEKMPEAALGDDPHSPQANSVAQSQQPPQPDIQAAIQSQPQEQKPVQDHDHIDLQLQPDHAAGPSRSGGGAR